MASIFPGGSNTYIPDHSATGYLITQFSRNPKDFPLARYIQYRPVKKDRGFYLRLTAEQAARLVGGNVDEYVWPDGADAPRRNNQTEKFEFIDYFADRYAPDFTLGDLSVEQAGWDLKGVETANLAQKQMTLRTQKVHDELETDANWDASHIADVTTDITGVAGRWDQSTTARMDIKKSINYGFDQIRKDTLGVVKNKSDLRLVLNPRSAQKIGECQEMINAFIQSTEARAQWEGKAPEYNDFGLPKYLYGVEVVVEDTVVVTSARDASTVVKEDACADGMAYLLARPGGLTAKVNSGPSYSTVMLFMMTDMQVEVRSDPDNKRLNGRIVDHFAVEVVAPITGFRFENIVA